MLNITVVQRSVRISSIIFQAQCPWFEARHKKNRSPGEFLASFSDKFILVYIANSLAFYSI